MASKENFVAKHMNTFNKASTHRDKKNDYVRSKETLSDWEAEWEDEKEELHALKVLGSGS